jgi:hypothetical protein
LQSGWAVLHTPGQQVGTQSKVAHTQAQNLEPPKKMPTTTLVKRKEREFCCEPCLQKVVGSVSSARLVGIVIAEKEREQLVARHDYKHGSSSSTA